jgi:hypothetical protein
MKATVFTMPFVFYGASEYGAKWVLFGQSIGAVCIWVIALFWCLRTIKTLKM